MLKSKLLHPDILAVLGRAGHGSKVLIADGNFPFSTRLGPKATLVNLNLSPGVVNCTQVLEALVAVMPIEAAAVMDTLKTGATAMPGEPPIWNEFRKILRDVNIEVQVIGHEEFLDEAEKPDVALTIATGEQRIYANLLLTTGVALPK